MLVQFICALIALSKDLPFETVKPEAREIDSAQLYVFAIRVPTGCVIELYDDGRFAAGLDGMIECCGRWTSSADLARARHYLITGEKPITKGA